MKEADISVIIPMFNAESNIERLIKCLLNQTQIPREIIVINDGSTDCSREIVSKIVDEIPFIKLINKVNGGTSSAKNEGIRNATSTYVMFVDSDDLLQADYIEKHNLAINGTAWICSGMQIIYEASNKSVLLPSTVCEKEELEVEDFLRKIEEAELFNVDVSKLYNLKILQDNAIFFDEMLTTGEDLKFNCEYAKHVDKCIMIGCLGYQYIRTGGESLVSRFKDDLYRQIEESINARRNLYEFYNLFSEDYFKNRYETVLVGSYILNIPNLYREGCVFLKREKISIIEKVKNEICKHKGIKVNNRILDFARVILLLFSPNICYVIFSLLFWIKAKF